MAQAASSTPEKVYKDSFTQWEEPELALPPLSASASLAIPIIARRQNDSAVPQARSWSLSPVANSPLSTQRVSHAIYTPPLGSRSLPSSKQPSPNSNTPSPSRPSSRNTDSSPHYHHTIFGPHGMLSR
jgi:hypothetical protein